MRLRDAIAARWSLAWARSPEARRSIEREGELRVAIRLMLDELDTLALHHAMLAEEARYPLSRPTGAALLFPAEVWEAPKHTLALRLADPEWSDLSTFMHTVPRVRVMVAAAEPESAISPALVQRFRDGALLASELHEKLSGVPAPSITERGKPSD